MNRNPYLILGVPFGASREQATAAFVRRARPLRRGGPAATDELTDLTWALNQIDELLKAPDEVMDVYRVPADRAAFAAEGPGVLRPGPEQLAARASDRDAALLELRRAAALDLLRGLVRLQSSRIARFAP